MPKLDTPALLTVLRDDNEGDGDGCCRRMVVVWLCVMAVLGAPVFWPDPHVGRNGLKIPFTFDDNEYG
jgi:hypothetical protein